MLVSKHVHSCLLIKESGKTILIDPGNYSYEEQALDIGTLDSLDTILITHEHPDHMHIPFIKDLLVKFPQAQIITNASAGQLLKAEGIDSVNQENEWVDVSPTPHEKIFGGQRPENVQFSVFGKLTHPGDSLTFKLSTPIIALPVQAPWGSLTHAVDYAVSLRPEVIIPIHDWHWNEKAREAFYARMEKYFSQQGIRFIPLKTREKIEV